MRWAMIALAFLATMINYLDRQALSVAAPVVCRDLHIGTIAYSRIVFAFMLAYTVMNGVSGPLIDRLGTRVGYALCMAWWSTSAVLHAFVRSASTLGIARFLLGMGEAGNWPGAVKVVAEWFPPSEAGLASGIFNSGAAVGAIIAPPLIAQILIHFGWPAAFLTVGLLGFGWLALWLPIYSTPQPAAVKEPGPKGWSLFRTRFVWSFTVSKIFLDPVWYFYVFWFPEYLSRARHFDMQSIGRYAWIPFAVAGLGNLAGGWLSAAIARSGVEVTRARKLAITVAAVMMAAAIPAVLTPSIFLSMAFVSVAMAGYTAAVANVLALPSDVFPPGSVASVYGFASMGSGFGGMLFSLLTGWIVDGYSYTPAFIGFGLLPMVCVFILWRVMGPLKTLERAV
jgi:MFS transporter, ACS family, hexuronate transporter